MAGAKKGDTVTVHYTGKLEDGTVFDSSESAEGGDESSPLEFVVGEGTVIPGFDAAILGMVPGDEKTVTIPVDQAYGPRIEEMVATLDRSEFPPDLDPQVGQQLEVTQEDGHVFSVLVTDVAADTVTLDANHPLAGRVLVFDLRLVGIS
jgi:peptidylprolyl isomerase